MTDLREAAQDVVDALIKNPTRVSKEVHIASVVLREVLAQPERDWQGLTENEIKHLWYEACQTNLELTSQLIVHLARNIEAKLKEKNA